MSNIFGRSDRSHHVHHMLSPEERKKRFVNLFHKTLSLVQKLTLILYRVNLLQSAVTTYIFHLYGTVFCDEL